jgi:Fe-S cluster assembly protein SufD
MNLNDYQNEFNKLIARQSFSSNLYPFRKDTFHKFLDSGLPTKKWEDWKHTDLSFLNKNNFRISETHDALSDSIDVSKYKIKNTYTAVIVNGHYIESKSELPQELKILTNSEKKNWTPKNKKETPFDLLNTSLCDSDISIVTKPNTVIKKPIHILFLCSGKDNLMINPQVNIDIMASSAATIIEQYVSDTSSFFQNTSVFASLEKNSSLYHIRIHSNSDETANISNLYVSQSDDSTYNYFQLVDGGALQRSDIYTDLKGKNATCSLSGLTLLDKKQHSATYITSDHIMPHCVSSQNFKSVLSGNSSGVFNGRTIVRQDSQKTDSKQSNKNLLLSDQAIMNSNPQLEIYADDVKCAHGSTTGALDSEALFYMQSRGINRKDAISLLIRGFVSELLNGIENEELKNHLFVKFDKWLLNNNQ